MDDKVNAISNELAALSSRLRTLVADAREENLELGWQTMLNESRQTIPRESDRPTGSVRPTGQLRDTEVRELVRLIERELSDRGFSADDYPEIWEAYEEGDGWSVGSSFELGRPMEVLRGFMVPAVEVLSSVRISLNAFAFLVIRGDKDVLHRDNHGHGIHYHYALANGTRTTTLVCWDTRWTSNNKNDAKGLVDRPLFHEVHGEGRYRKAARPDCWGDEKRQSIREACVTDLRKKDIGQFLCASDNASSVWPLGQTVTTRPSSLKIISSKKQR